MKINQRIPMDNAGYSFGYIEFEQEYDNPEEAIAENVRLTANVGNQGLSVKQWAEMRKKVLTSHYQPTEEEYTQFSRYQRAWWKDTDNTLKSFNHDQTKD